MTMPEATTDTASKQAPWGSNAVGLAKQMARADFPRGDLAGLRRMSPLATDAAAFWRLAAQYDLLGSAIVERKWALIMNGIALMTPTAGKGTAHDPERSVGTALFLGGESARTTGFYSETRLNRLLTARGTMLQTLLTRMFRMLAAAGASFDWREMARFVLYADYDEEKAERARRHIARAYYREERRQAVPSENQS